MSWDAVPENAAPSAEDFLLAIDGKGNLARSPAGNVTGEGGFARQADFAALVASLVLAGSSGDDVSVAGLPVGAKLAIVASYGGGAYDGSRTGLAVVANGVLIASWSLSAFVSTVSLVRSEEGAYSLSIETAFAPLSMTTIFTVSEAGDHTFALDGPSGVKSLLVLRL